MKENGLQKKLQELLDTIDDDVLRYYMMSDWKEGRALISEKHITEALGSLLQCSESPDHGNWRVDVSQPNKAYYYFSEQLLDDVLRTATLIIRREDESVGCLEHYLAEYHNASYWILSNREPDFWARVCLVSRRFARRSFPRKGIPIQIVKGKNVLNPVCLPCIEAGEWSRRKCFTDYDEQGTRYVNDCPHRSEQLVRNQPSLVHSSIDFSFSLCGDCEDSEYNGEY